LVSAVATAEAGGNITKRPQAGVERKLRFALPRAWRVRQSGFCSKKVRISTKRYRQFTIWDCRQLKSPQATKKRSPGR